MDILYPCFDTRMGWNIGISNWWDAIHWINFTLVLMHVVVGQLGLAFGVIQYTTKFVILFMMTFNRENSLALVLLLRMMVKKS